MVKEAESRNRRADAERNRLLILEAGRRVLEANGPGVAFYEVAAEAGVGQGTLYRHFPNKQALVRALFEENVDALQEGAQASIAGRDSPEEAVRLLARLTADDASLAALLSGADHAEWLEAVVQRVVEIILSALEPGQKAGLVREGVSEEDVRIAMQMLGGAIAGTDPAERREQADRAAELLLRGILSA